MADNGLQLKHCAAGPAHQQGKPQLAGNRHLHPAQSSRLTIVSTGARPGSRRRLPARGSPIPLLPDTGDTRAPQRIKAKA